MRYWWIGILFLVWSACGGDEEVMDLPLQVDYIDIQIADHEGRYDAGDTISITADVDGYVDQRLHALITYSFGEYMIPLSVESDQLVIALPEVLAQLRGEYRINIYSNGVKKASTQFGIDPLEPYEHVSSYSGPATIESSGIDWHLITAIPKDKYNNPVADGTEVEFNLRYPDGRERRQIEEIEGMLTGIRIDPIRQAGKIYTGITSGNAHATEKEVRVTPTWPRDFTLEVLEYIPYAEQRQIVRIRSSVVKDRYDNTVADGTAMVFVVDDGRGGITRYNSFTVSGRGEVVLENPHVESRWTIYAYIDQSARTPEISLFFEGAVMDIPVAYEPDSQQIKFGPVIGALDQFVPNGVMMTYQVSGEGINTAYEVELYEGYYIWDIPLKTYPTGDYHIEAQLGDSQQSFDFSLVNDETHINSGLIPGYELTALEAERLAEQRRIDSLDLVLHHRYLWTGLLPEHQMTLAEAEAYRSGANLKNSSSERDTAMETQDPDESQVKVTTEVVEDTEVEDRDEPAGIAISDETAEIRNAEPIINESPQRRDDSPRTQATPQYDHIYQARRSLDILGAPSGSYIKVGQNYRNRSTATAVLEQVRSIHPYVQLLSGPLGVDYYYVVIGPLTNQDKNRVQQQLTGRSINAQSLELN